MAQPASLKMQAMMSAKKHDASYRWIVENQEKLEKFMPFELEMFFQGGSTSINADIQFNIRNLPEDYHPYKCFSDKTCHVKKMTDQQILCKTEQTPFYLIKIAKIIAKNDDNDMRPFDIYHLVPYADEYFTSIHNMEWLKECGALDVIEESYDVRSRTQQLINIAFDIADAKQLQALAGDIESNPGPVSYKESCKKQHKKNVSSRYIEERKQLNVMKRKLREIQEEAKRLREPLSVELQSDFGLSFLSKVAADVYSGYRLNTSVNKADAMMEEVTKVIDHFRGTLDNITSYCANTINVFSLVTDIIFAFFQVSFAASGSKFASLSVELTRLLIKYGIPTATFCTIRNFISEWTRKDETSVELQAGFCDLIAEISPTHLVVFLSAVLGVIFMNKVPSKSCMEDVLARVGNVCRSLKNVTDFNNVIHTSLKESLDAIKESLFGILPKQEISKLIDGLDKWFDDVALLSQREDEFRTMDLVMFDVPTILRIEALHDQGLIFSREISEKKIDSRLIMPFQMHMRFLSSIMQKIDTSGAFGSRPRIQPSVFWLYGESGVGKSGMAWPFAIDLNTIFMSDEEQASKFAQNIYFRNVEQEFWDNYQRQNVVVYDDFGQRADSQAKPNEEYMELIRMANIAPYPLHMAHLEDKRKTRFTSKVIILTSNNFDHNVQSITFPDAYRRRVDLCGRVENKPEYQKVGYSATTSKPVMRLDSDKVRLETGNVIDTRAYLIQRVDPMTKEDIGKPMEYWEFMEEASKIVEKRVHQSKDMNEYLEKYAREAFVRKVMIQDNLTVTCSDPKAKPFVIRPVETELQIKLTDPNPEAFTTEEYFDALNYDSSEWLELAKKGAVKTINGITATYSQVETYLYEEYLKTPMASARGYVQDHFNKWTPPNISDVFTVKFSQTYELLCRAKQHAKSILSEYWDKFCKLIADHPYIAFATVFSSISALLYMTGWWNKITGMFDVPIQEEDYVDISENIRLRKKPQDLQTISVEDFKACKGNTDRVLDLTPYDNYKLEKILPDILGTASFTSCVGILIGHPAPWLCGFFAGLFKGIWWYTESTMVHWHHKVYKLREPVTHIEIPFPKPITSRHVIESKELDDMCVLAGYPSVAELPEGETIDGGIAMTKAVNFNLEASQSGAHSTKAPQTPKIEATQSGAHLTKAPKTIRVEASQSGSQLTVKPKTIRVEAISADLQMITDQVTQNIISNNIFSNMYKIRKTTENSRYLVNGLFVKGQCMLVPGHLLGFLQPEDEIEIENICGQKFILPYSTVKAYSIINKYGKNKEAAILVFPNYVHNHKDITKHFSTSRSMAQYKKARTIIPTMRYSEKLDKLLFMLIGTQEAEAVDYELPMIDHSKNVSVVLREGLKYQAPTMAGDCGGPIFINETQVLRKIAGIHVAGNAEGYSYAESITVDDIERTLHLIPKECQIQLDWDDVLVPPTDVQMPIGELFDPLPYFQAEIPSLGFSPMGKIEQRIYEPSKTEILESLVYGAISDIKTKPAILRNGYIDGEYVHMKHRNLAKCAMNTPYIPSPLIEQAMRVVRPTWLDNRRKELARVLTFEESIRGNEYSEYIAPINRQSSPGYPWCLERPSGMPGKTGWFGDGEEYLIPEDVRIAVNKRIENAKKGIRTPTFWIDTLKDERRPIEKVDALKTRVFSNGPMDFNLAFRMYYLGFIAHLMENRIENEVSIGTNVYSQDWARTAKKLSRKGLKVIAGDFQTFDGTLNSCMMWKFVDLANEFYNDGEENALIRQVLFLEVLNSIHLCDGSVYMMSHSQPSGNPATTPLNCLINSLGLAMVFIILAGKYAPEINFIEDYPKHVSLVSYGDDNVINFSDVVAEWFNMDTITWAYSQFGMIYTDEMKSAQGTAPKWKTLAEVQYLKRSFRYDEKTRTWKAPLTLDTILEMPNWRKGVLDAETGTRVNCETAISELAQHPEEVFNKWSKVISDAFYERTNKTLITDTYTGYNNVIYTKYYL